MALGKGILKCCVFSILKSSSKNHCVPAAKIFISSFSRKTYSLKVVIWEIAFAVSKLFC